MTKFYFIIFFVCCTIMANAQEAKPAEAILPTEAVPAKAVRFYPNPATTVINFEVVKNLKDITLQVYNFVGKKVYELNNVSQKTALSLTDFYRGVYIFQLRDKAGRIIDSGKFQIVK